MARIYIGCDPGKSGAIAILTDAGKVACTIKLDGTEHDIAESLRAAIQDAEPHAMLERVHAMPQQGVSSTFKFGQSFGFLRGLLVALQIPFDEVTPAKWQNEMKCRTRGDKNITKQAAQRRWPAERITHRTADALLLAEHCRQVVRW